MLRRHYGRVEWGPDGKVEDYRRLAAECIYMAQEADNPGCNVTLVDVASIWLRLADQAEKNSQSNLVYEMPVCPSLRPQ